jgi:putative peptide zinc metalloprotease protein
MSLTLQLAPGVVVHPALDGGAAERVVELPDRRLARVGPDVGRLLDVLAASAEPPTAEGVAARLGAPWTPRIVAETHGRLDELGVTGAGRPTTARRLGRIEYRPPMSLQLTVLEPSGLFARAPRALTGRWAALAALLLGVAGVPIVAAALSPGAAALHRPAAVGTYLLVVVALLVAVALHELAHGAVLAAHGGRPRRFGVMIFYLLPAFFCDVSDAWRLAPRARVRVAMAGIVAQCAIAGIAALASLGAGGDVQQGLLFFALLCYAYGLGNLMPFLKLDGYVALAGGLDVSHLRRKAMGDFLSCLAHVMFGARAERSLPERAWAPWFGAACTLTPVVVLVGAMGTLAPAILPLGAVGAILILLLAVLLALLLVRVVTGFTGRALRGGARRGPTFAVLGVALVALVVSLALVKVSRTLQGGYAAVNGAPTAVLALGAPTGELAAGTPVLIRRAGLLPGETVVAGAVTGRARRCQAPLGSLVPVRDARHTLPATCIALRLTGDAPATGRLSVRLPAKSAAGRLAELFLSPSLRALGIAR